MTTLIAPLKQLEALFVKLSERWRQEIATPPAYQRIIGLGPQVIPLILS